jgi:hypothetical protein
VFVDDNETLLIPTRDIIARNNFGEFIIRYFSPKTECWQLYFVNSFGIRTRIDELVDCDLMERFDEDSQERILDELMTARQSNADFEGAVYELKEEIREAWNQIKKTPAALARVEDKHVITCFLFLVNEDPSIESYSNANAAYSELYHTLKQTANS